MVYSPALYCCRNDLASKWHSHLIIISLPFYQQKYIFQLSYKVFLFPTKPNILEHLNTRKNRATVSRQTCQALLHCPLLQVKGRGVWRAMCQSWHRPLKRHKGSGKALWKLLIYHRRTEENLAV